jgi:zinc protease
MITVITGDVDADEAFAAIHDVFDGFERRARAPAVLPTEPDQVSPRFQRKTGAYEVSRLEWMYPAVPLQHPDAPALDMLAAIVGRGKSSRLVRELKERRQLVFEINAWAWTPKEAGIFGISATFDPEKEDAVRDAIANEINSWQNDAFEQEEIDKARRMLLVSELSDLETMDGQAGSIGAGAFYAGDPRFSERYIERLQAVTPETLSRVAKAYLDPQKVNLAILSPDLPQPGKSDTEEAAATALPPTRFELPNGVRLVVREDRRLPFVYMCTASRGGLLSETEENNGITRLMTELLVRGTEQYGAEEIAGQVEQLGASLTSYSGDNSFGLRARCLSSDTETVFNLLADSLLHPTFPDDEVAKQKALQAAAIRRQHEDPFFLARKALRASLFGAHPYHMLAVGDTNAVEKLTREQLQQHYANLLKPDNLVISLFGDISTEEARQLAEQAFARLAMETKTGDELQSVPEVVTKRAEQRVPRDQAILLVGYTGLEVDDPRADAMTLIQEAMSGLSSTLGAEVREKRGLVYYVGAFQRLGLDPGTFALYGGTTEEAVPELERLMGEEVARIRREGLGPEELELARAELLGKHQMNLQDTADLAQLCALNELYGVGYDHVFSFEKRIRAVTNEDIIDAAGDILIDEHKAVSVVLPELNKESEAKEDDD